MKKPECKQSSRIKEMKRQQSREFENGVLSDSQTKSPEEDESVDVVNSPESSSDVSEPPSDGKSDIPADEYSFEVGDKIQVKYGRGRNHRLYDAKVLSLALFFALAVDESGRSSIMIAFFQECAEIS